MELKFETFQAPAHWASALINDDRTGMSDEEELEMDGWLEANGIGPVVGCSEVGEMGRFEGMFCDVCTYTYQVLS